MVTQGSIFVLPAFAIASFSCKVAFLVCESLKEVGYLFSELKNIELTQSKALIFSSFLLLILGLNLMAMVTNRPSSHGNINGSDLLLPFL